MPRLNINYKLRNENSTNSNLTFYKNQMEFAVDITFISDIILKKYTKDQVITIENVPLFFQEIIAKKDHLSKSFFSYCLIAGFEKILDVCFQVIDDFFRKTNKNNIDQKEGEIN